AIGNRSAIGKQQPREQSIGILQLDAPSPAILDPGKAGGAMAQSQYVRVRPTDRCQTAAGVVLLTHLVPRDHVPSRRGASAGEYAQRDFTIPDPQATTVRLEYVTVPAGTVQAQGGLAVLVMGHKRVLESVTPTLAKRGSSVSRDVQA